ncbi:heat shock 70-kDa protein-like protein [Tetterwort vein chlorosis virus]|uniref:Heat shock 70-kDa protein-like protein n=1 Tax=Tetterwort vein chlorosis virus TaxID=1712389 RepID=A0A0M5KZB1_9CLOS|nr:heat shock 70-kDa protein-like protein [Tetterwort vein chlorosis virus]ALE18219.1 heat shock 70-kDa protein-like protein [Tetterwort vein chlorosis virus]
MATAKAGLDFGTTFSTISAYVNGVMRVLKLNNTEFIPTCLAITNTGDVVVGGPAQVLESGELANCYFYDLKRWVGVDKINFSIIKNKIRPQYVAELKGNDVYLTGINRGYSCTYTVKQLILLYIETLVRLFSKVEGLNIVSLNVSVPADYKCKQRMFMKSVCDSLGFSLRRIINEPSAAAIYFVSKYPNYDAFLMYDLGGGTYDSSLIVKDGKYVTVADTEGDSFLGGRDIDRSISKYIMKKYDLQHPLSADYLAAIKEDANSKGRESFNVMDVTGRVLNVKFTKDEMDKCIQSYSDRSLKILENMVLRNNVTSGALFLVGGSSLLEKIQRDVKSFAKTHNLTCIIDPDLRSAVSYGCSMSHAQEDSGNMTYIDCNSHPLMDITLFCGPRVIVRKPMAIPYTYMKEELVKSHYSTILNVYEGSDPFVLYNDWLISARLKTADYCKLGQTLVYMYRYNVDGILELLVRNKETGVESVLPNTFTLTEKIDKLKLTLTQLSNIDELATLITILGHFRPELKDLLTYVKTPTIFENKINSFTTPKALYQELITYNANFVNK